MMRRILPVIAVVTLLFALPLGSWYYLNKGFNFRKSALAELEAKGPFLTGDAVEHATLDSILERKVSVIHIAGIDDKDDPEQLLELHDVFDHHPNFQLLSMVPASQQALWSRYSADHQAWNIHVREDGPAWQGRFGGHSLILVDSSGQVRRHYDQSLTDFQSLTKHTSIVLPLLREKKIRLERDGE